jgi:Protein of unknown function (DUF3303)
MKYVAYVTIRSEQRGNTALVDRSRKWWNEGGRPSGLKTVAAYGTLGSSPDVFVLETDDPEDLRAMTSFWSDIDFEIHPAVDLIEVFRGQGMQVA